jgi:hypothetical protein
MNVADNTFRLSNETPASPPTPHCQIRIFVIQEKRLIKKANIGNLFCSEQHRCTTPGADFD